MGFKVWKSVTNTNVPWENWSWNKRNVTTVKITTEWTFGIFRQILILDKSTFCIQYFKVNATNPNTKSRKARRLEWNRRLFFAGIKEWDLSQRRAGQRWRLGGWGLGMVVQSMLKWGLSWAVSREEAGWCQKQRRTVNRAKGRDRG